MNSLPFRLAAIDLDDTLLGPDKSISAANAAAVRRLRAEGVHVTLASGRRHANMLRFHRQLELTGPIVSCNGALVQDAETGDTFLQRLLPAVSAAAIVQDGAARGITQNYYHSDGAVYAASRSEWTEIYESRTGSAVDLVPDIRAFSGQSALKIIWIGEPAAMAALLGEMQKRWPDLYITTTDPEYLEFMAPNVNKAAGLEVVAKRLGIPRSEVLAFGDGNNDLPMLQWAGCGVAMANAHPHVQKQADRVAPAGNPETSLARAVELVLSERERPMLS